MPRHEALDLAIRLGRQAEAVCRHYLSSGHRVGNYWLVGDVHNTPGRSMFVRLSGSETGKGAAGKWTDASEGCHGDLLDIIREAQGITDFKDVLAEARRFLALPHPEPAPQQAGRCPTSRAAPGSRKAARRLFAMAQPIAGSLVETYLRERAITALTGTGALRYHPCCYYRSDHPGPSEVRPAMIACVTDLVGRQTGAHRTWLAPDGSGKAPIDTPRRAMGELLGHGVRFGVPDDVLAVGEGIETVLSPRQVLPGMPMLAALSAAHLAAVLFPATLRRLYLLCDRDPAGDRARDSLLTRAASLGIEAIALVPVGGDFNDDLRHRGAAALSAALKDVLYPDDRRRFLQG